jgi:peroxiredoxin
MLPLGTPAPTFSLPDVSSDRIISLSDFSASTGLLVAFLCAHCPYVLHIQSELAAISRDYSEKSLAIVAITSNDALTYPQDAPTPTAAFAHSAGFTFPFLYDESQSVAQAFTASCTPDFFLFDSSRHLVYRGQLDRSRPNSGTPDGADLRAALQALLNHQPINPDQKPSTGCGIKWKLPVDHQHSLPALPRN